MRRSFPLLIALAIAFVAGLWIVKQRVTGPPVGMGEVVPAVPVGATLLPGLDGHHFAITTRQPDVQRWFDQGLALAWGFNHEAAERSFLKAAELDPACAMCWWGAALVLGPHVNAAMDPANNGKAWQRIGRAQSLAAAASSREQAYIKALAARYAEQPPADRKPLDEAWAAALGELVQASPDDLDAAVFHAEALMDLQPWNYYDLKGQPKGHIDEVVAIGPPIMMKGCADTTRPFGIKTMVSLNPVMVDGTGMCGGCRCTVGGQTRFACVDGPHFDAFDVDFDELIQRGRIHDLHFSCIGLLGFIEQFEVDAHGQAGRCRPAFDGFGFCQSGR